MSLQAGTRLGPHEILSPLGARGIRNARAAREGLGKKATKQ
jgi:hypothetical protein